MANRLVMAFGASLLLLVIVVVIGQSMINQTRSAVNQSIRSWRAKEVLINELFHVLEHVREANLLHVTARSAGEMEAAEQARSQLVGSMAKLRPQYEKLISSPQEKVLFEGLVASIDRFISVSERTIELSRAGRKEEAREWVMERVTPVYRTAEARFEEFQVYATSEHERMVDRIDRIYAVFGRIMGFLTFFGLVAALLVYVLSIRRITHTLKHLTATTEQVAAGRLDVNVEVNGPDEFGRLAQSFNVMAHSLRQRFQDMKGLVEVGRAVSSSLIPGDLLRTIVERAGALLGTDHAAICVRPEGEEGASLRASTFPPDDPRYEAARQQCEADLHAVCAERAPRVVHDVAGFATALYVPLLVEERVIGAIAFFGRADWVVDGWRLEMADMLARQVVVAIEKARLHQGLREGYLSTIAALAAAVEARDSYTGGHCERIADYGAAAARRLGLPPAGVEVVRHACLLHDVGKIGVRDKILLKPGRLTEKEYAEMKQHAIIGARIVGSVPFLRDVAVLLRHHHERYDGRGYPDGLAGEAIPFGARIVAVVDAYEAMISDRPYRQAMSYEQAIKELESCAGSQFDPVVVEAFMNVMEAEDACQGVKGGLWVIR